MRQLRGVWRYDVAHITRVIIENLAGRTEPLSLDLDHRLNVFFGLNGSGKTSLLHLLHSAMTGNALTVENVPFSRAEVHIYSQQMDAIIVRTLLKRDFPRSVSEGTPFGSISQRIQHADGEIFYLGDRDLRWTTEPVDKTSGAYAHIFLPISRMFTTHTPRVEPSFFGTGPQKEMDEQLNESFAEAITSTWREYFSKILSEIQVAQQEGLANILRAVLLSKPTTREAGELDPEVAFQRVSSFLQRQGSVTKTPGEAAFRRKYRDDPQLRRVVADIDEVERRIRAATRPKRNLEKTLDRMFSGGKSVSLDVLDIAINAGDGVNISLGRLSSGEKQILRLLIDTLRAESNSLIVDEPELSLHIDWQRSLLGTMRTLNPSAQIIVATHSPEIMAEVHDRHIHSL